MLRYNKKNDDLIYSETKIEFKYDGSLDTEGKIISKSSYKVSDYIDLDDVYGIYRTGSSDKYSMYAYSFYDESLNHIKTQSETTDYNFDNYNGQIVTWFNIEPSAKYVRISHQTPRTFFTYWKVKKITKVYDVPYLTFFGNDILKRVIDITSIYSENLLNPNEFVSTDFYYDFSDGFTKIININNCRMSEKTIQVNSSKLYFRTKKSISSNNIILIYCYNDDEYLGYVNSRLNGDIINGIGFTLKSGTTKVRFYTNAPISEIDSNEICFTELEVDEFTEYNLKTYINEDTIGEIKTYTPLKGKTIANFGDSIFGNRRPPNDVSTALAEITGATVYNLGFGGCRMAKHDTNWDPFSMYRLADSIATNDFTV